MRGFVSKLSIGVLGASLNSCEISQLVYFGLCSPIASQCVKGRPHFDHLSLDGISPVGHYAGYWRQSTEHKRCVWSTAAVDTDSAVLDQAL